MINETAPSSQAEHYRTHGYAHLQGLFPPIVLQEFHRTLQKRLNLGESSQFLSQTPLLTKPAIQVYSMQYPPMAAFHWGLTPVATELAGCELVPTYAYFRVYQQADVCLVHFDREACEHSMSLMVELADEIPWALCVEHMYVERPPPTADTDFGSEEFATIPMNAGDAVLYRGVNHRHGRIHPNPNRWSAHLFMHWVDPNGPHAEHAFDQVAQRKAGVAAA